MFIQTETTPNPSVLKFLPGRAVMEEGTAHFYSAKEAGNSPLAAKLFEVDYVTAVFFGADFISVTKIPDARWDVIKADILTTIMEHFTSGQPVILHGGDKGFCEPEALEEDNAELAKQIREILDTRVRPAVAQDGGDIIYKGFKDGIVKLELHGACSGCPSSTMTLKDGIENLLKHYIPEVKGVEAVM